MAARARRLVMKYPDSWAQGVWDRFEKECPRAADFLVKFCRVSPKTYILLLRANDPAWAECKAIARRAIKVTDVKVICEERDRILQSLPYQAIDEALQLDLRFEGR